MVNLIEKRKLIKGIFKKGGKWQNQIDKLEIQKGQKGKII